MTDTTGPDTEQNYLDKLHSGQTVRLEGYPHGRWFPTTRRRGNRSGKEVLYQRVTVADTLTIEDWWRPQTDTDETPRRAIAAMPAYTGRKPSIASHPRTDERSGLRRELRLWCLYYLDAIGPDAQTLTELTEGMHHNPANTRWSAPDIRSTFAQTQELKLWVWSKDLEGRRCPALTESGQAAVASGNTANLFHPDDRDPFTKEDK